MLPQILNIFVIIALGDDSSPVLAQAIIEINGNLINFGLGLQGLYSTTNCADNILGRFTMLIQIKLQE